ncbi:MAG: NAD(P)H-dependent glycerol-3-phosphate dehydrogenase [Candidatus Omnitrophota bacterium]
MKRTITILGDGGWGTTLSILLNQNGYKVCIWGMFGDYIESLKEKRENIKFLKGVKIPKAIHITSDLKEALNYSSAIILAIPSQFLRRVLRRIDAKKLKGYIFLSATKGIEERSLKRMSEVVFDELGKVNLAVLSGPNIAQEIARGKLAVSVVSSKDNKIAKLFQDMLISKNFRVYTNSDVVGTELGGSLKNIIALACGISDGLNLGTNAKAALLTRGLVEISRLGIAMGAKKETFSGVSGLGDLITTCTSLYSRNRFVGEQIAKGRTLADIVKKMQMIAEGIATTRAAYELSKRHKVEMPITKEIYSVLYRRKSPKRAVSDLMQRNKKPEH